MPEVDLIFYQFSRSKVERRDFSHFLRLYGPEKLPTGRRLREMMNTIVFGIDGYDQDSREIHTIPEIRGFYSAFHDAWPYWLYFCNLDVDSLKPLVSCCLASLEEMKVDAAAQVAITYDRVELLDFLKRDFVSMNEMCQRAEMFEERVFDRTQQVFEYFGLPFQTSQAQAKT